MKMASCLDTLELVFAEESRVRLASIHMKRDHIGLFQQFVERVATVGVAHGELLFNVVEQHAHAKRLGDDGKLGADVAVADDAERLASDLMGAGGRTYPTCRASYDGCARECGASGR